MADQDWTNVWTMGKIEPGWYIARNGWSKAYAEHLGEMGYSTVRSVYMPDANGNPVNEK